MRISDWSSDVCSSDLASFFPIPPHPMLGLMCLANPKKAVRYALICTIASVMGGMLGYTIGFFLYESVGLWLLGVLGLRDAARDRNRRAAAVGTLQPADVRIDFLRRFLAYVAGVEHDQIGVGPLGSWRIAHGAQHLRHAFAGRAVHLASKAFDVKLTLRGIGNAAWRKKV